MRFHLHLAALPLIASLTACGGGGGTTGPSGGTPSSPSTPTTPSVPSTPETPAQTSAVTVQNNSFSPANIQVTPGTTVTWTWSSGSDIHNVTFQDGAFSGDKSAGGSYSRTFATAGTFSYSCTLHGGMNGSVLVK